MTEYIYHLTGDKLRALMTLAITKWEALDRDVTAAVEAALAEDDARRLENSLPLVDEEEEDTDGFDYDGWYPEHVLEVDDLEFDDRIPYDGIIPAIEDEGIISAEALLELACPYCDGEYIITHSDNMTIATCSQCGYKELVENKPDNTSPAAIGLEPAA